MPLTRNSPSVEDKTNPGFEGVERLAVPKEIENLVAKLVEQSLEIRKLAIFQLLHSILGSKPKEKLAINDELRCCYGQFVPHGQVNFATQDEISKMKERKNPMTTT